MKTNTTSVLSNSSVPLIVGAGRLARHWKTYLQLSELPYLEWDRRSAVTFADFAKLHSKQISSVYLLISDGAIEAFHQAHRALLLDATWFHASGALVVPGVIDAHPMMTFSANGVYPLATYQSMAITTAAATETVRAKLLGALPNPVQRIRAEDKPLYHALCVLGAAGTGALWSLLQAEWQKIGVANSAQQSYQSQIFANLESMGKAAITGPWVRGDLETTQKNQAAMPNESSQKLYALLKGVFDEYGQH